MAQKSFLTKTAMFKKCPHCHSNAILKIHAPHVDHSVMHVVAHHANDIAKVAARNPYTALFGLVATGIALVADAVIENDYTCQSCKRRFKG